MLPAIAQQVHGVLEAIEMNFLMQGWSSAHPWINEGSPAEIIGVGHYVLGAHGEDRSWMPISQDLMHVDAF